MVKVAKKAKVKTTRKEIKKPDEFLVQVSKLADYLSNHWQQVAVGIAGVLVIAIGIHLFNLYHRTRAERSSAMLDQAMKAYSAEVLNDKKAAPKKPAPAKKGLTFKTGKARDVEALKRFRKLLAKYPSTGAGVLARAFAGHCLRRLGRYKEAVKEYAGFLGSVSSSSKLRFIGVNGMAYAHEGMGKLKEATRTYEQYLSSGGKDLPALDQIRFRLAALYERQGKKNLARKYYKKIVALKTSLLKYDAERRLKLLR